MVLIACPTGYAHMEEHMRDVAMRAETAYWALLTEPRPNAESPDRTAAWLADLLAGWLDAGNRSLRDLFELHPDVLAAALGRPIQELAPLLALRARRSRVERMLAGLARAGVDLLVPWDRRYPRSLRDATIGESATPSSDHGPSNGRHLTRSAETHADDAFAGAATRSSAWPAGSAFPPVLWFAGNLDLLAARPIALLGARDAPPEAIAFARALAGGLASRGRPTLSGVARAIERAALGAALAEPDGAFIAVLGQGISRTLPDLQRLQGQIRAGRLLLISAWHPEMSWQPRLEPARAALVVALAERIVLAQMEQDDGTCQIEQLARRLGRPLLVRTAEGDKPSTPLDPRVQEVRWPAESAETLVDEILATPAKRGWAVRKSRAESEVVESGAKGEQKVQDVARSQQPHRHRAKSAHAPADGPMPEHAASEPAKVPIAMDALSDTVIRLLRRRRGTIGKGALLLALAVPEAVLDRALAALIAEGKVTQRPHRTGIGYEALKNGKDDRRETGFQLSLFGQED
jgi:predicted Rossmann fold nucleotide-binding protein DprA/Smf involved in DNA uptake